MGARVLSTPSCPCLSLSLSLSLPLCVCLHTCRDLMSHKFHQHVHVHAHLNRNEKSRDKLGLLGWLHVSARSQPVLSLIESSTPSERTDDALEPRRRTTNKTFSQVLSHSFFFLSRSQSFIFRLALKGQESVRVRQVRGNLDASAHPSYRLHATFSPARSIIIWYRSLGKQPPFPHRPSCRAWLSRGAGPTRSS